MISAQCSTCNNKVCKKTTLPFRAQVSSNRCLVGFLFSVKGEGNPATFSNCLESLKRRATAAGRKTQCSRWCNGHRMVKTPYDVTMSNEQPSPTGCEPYGCSSQTKWEWVYVFFPSLFETLETVRKNVKGYVIPLWADSEDGATHMLKI